MSTKIADLGAAVRAAFAGILNKEFPEDLSSRIAMAAGEEVQRQAIELAPFRTGTLEGSSELTESDGRAIIIFDTPYAAEAHERPETAVGPGTLAKPGNELGPAGPKYLERPLVAMQERLKTIAAEAMTEKLREEL